MWAVLWMIASPASAGEIEAFVVEEFGGAGEDRPVAGRDGWEGGYDGDGWREFSGFLLSWSDDNVGDGDPGFGAGSAMDNWLVNGPDVEDVVLRASGGNQRKRQAGGGGRRGRVLRRRRDRLRRRDPRGARCRLWR